MPYKSDLLVPYTLRTQKIQQYCLQLQILHNKITVIMYILYMTCTCIYVGDSKEPVTQQDYSNHVYSMYNVCHVMMNM